MLVYEEKNRGLAKNKTKYFGKISFESKILEYFCFPIIVVYCADKQKQVERLMVRNKIGQEEAG